MKNQRCECRCSEHSCNARAFAVSTPVMTYMPVQEWGEVYSEPLALFRGTLFVTLDKPFCGKGGCCHE